jgi:hypothetical protein
MSVLRKCLFALSLILPCGFVIAASDFKIAPDVALDSAAVAPGTNRYLVVWRDLRAGESAPRMYGATVAMTGLVSADFPISDAAGIPAKSPVQRTTVAFDGTNFLVVWADTRAGGTGVRGAFVSPTGVVQGADFLIATTARTSNVAPQLVYTGTEYFVAWQEDSPSPTGGMQVFFARVTTAGVSTAAVAVPHTGTTVPAQSLEFLVSGPSNEVLIVFQNAAQSPTETRATRIAFNNTAIAPAEGALLFKRDFSAQGFGVPIGAAYDGTQYIVLSSHSAQIDSSVFRTRLMTDGQIIRPSGPFAEVGQGVTGLAEDEFPRTYFNNGSEFLFIRNSRVSEIAYHVLTKRVQLDGKDRDPNVPLIDTAARGVLNGGAAAAIGSQYLVIWMDGRRSEFQPARELNIYGALLDGLQPGDETKPFIKAVGGARPIFGSSPLLVGFGAGGSSGIIDTVSWNFGDGTTPSTVGSVSHTYQNSGEYIAVLSLTRAGFVMRDFVRILVDSNERGGGGGPPQVIGGSLGAQSTSVVSDIFVTSFLATLNFGFPNTDTMRFFGYFDPSVLPVTLKDKSGRLTIAGRTYTFTLDQFGFYTTTEVKPVVRFQLNSFSGAFALVTNSDELQSLFAPLGAGNEATGKTAKEVVVPFKLEFEGLTLESTLTTNYLATAGKTGRLQYFFRTIGQPGAGFFHIFDAKATEKGKPGSLTHEFKVTGNAGFGGIEQMQKAEAGRFRVTIGNYTEDIPVSSFSASSNLLGYKAPKGAVGVKTMIYNVISGTFLIEFRGIAAEGDNPSGMALASSPFARADMALALDLDLSDGRNYQGSAYVRFGRQKAGSKKWTRR